MNKKVWYVIFVILLVVIAYILIFGSPTPSDILEDTLVIQTPTVPMDPKSGTFIIEKQRIQLNDGISALPAMKGVSTMIKTYTTDIQAIGKVDPNNMDDLAVVLRQEPGGSGIFYYFAVMLDAQNAYLTTNSVLLGDRIKVESLSITPDRIIEAKILDRNPGEPFSTAPSVEKILRFKVQGLTLKGA